MFLLYVFTFIKKKKLKIDADGKIRSKAKPLTVPGAFKVHQGGGSFKLGSFIRVC